MIADQVDLHICIPSNEVHDVVVNGNWSLANLREYIALRFGQNGDFKFVVDGIPVCKGKELPNYVGRSTFRDL